MLDRLFAELNTRAVSQSDDATRLFHGRGHCYEGLDFINIDWFSPLLWVVLYGDVADDTLQQLNAGLQTFAQAHVAIECVSVQRRVAGKAQQTIIYGELQGDYFAQEDGASYSLNLGDNQNIGFFLDAKPARQWLRGEAADARVLNLFSYTCSFSVAALQACAYSVVNIDMAKGALATGQRNHAKNQLLNSRASFLPHDIFRSTKKLSQFGPYDIVIIDPPSRQKGSFVADKDYGRLLKKLAPMLAGNAQVLACLNAPYLGENFLTDLFAEHLPQLNYVRRLAQREDFPESDLNCCLKMQLFQA
jgi:23S rRNA (cytosine1962-C5)-methyltransferase